MKVERRAPSRATELGLVSALLAAAAGARLLVALESPHSLVLTGGGVPSDLGVIGLMAKHLLDRGELSTFFWGQDWYGGLDSFLHAASFLVFGVTPFAMRMTALLLFLGFALATYLVARRLWGVGVALSALAWCAAAPSPLSIPSVVPITYYIEAPLLGTLLILLTVGLVSNPGAGRRARRWILLGFVAGISWWVSPLSAFYLCALPAAILVNAGASAVLPGLAFGLPAFLLGAAPLLVSALSSAGGGALGAMTGSLGLATAWQGVARYFLVAAPGLVDLPRYRELFGAPVAAAVGLFYVAAFVVFLARGDLSAGNAVRSSTTRPRGLFTLVFLSTLVLYASSENALRSSSPRLLMPLYSILPLAVGFAVWHAPRIVRPAAVAMFVLVVATGLGELWRWAGAAAGFEERGLRAARLFEWLKANDLRLDYLDYYDGSAELTFLSREEVIFASPRAERYRPYELQLEAAADPGFLSRSPGALTGALRLSGGGCREDAVEGFFVSHGCSRVERGYRQVPARELRTSGSASGERAAATLDRTVGTSWSSDRGRTPGEWFQIDLGSRRRVGRVRLWNRPPAHGAYSLDLEVQTSDDGLGWSPAIARTRATYHYWSGPRLYDWEIGFRQDLEIPAVEARYVRVVQHDEAPSPWAIDEVYVYEEVAPVPAPDNAIEILEAVRSSRLERVWADRWMSARIRRESGGGVATVEPFTNPAPKRGGPPPRFVDCGPETGFVVGREDADALEESFTARAITVSRSGTGRWQLIVPRDRCETPRWWWTGFGIVAAR